MTPRRFSPRYALPPATVLIALALMAAGTGRAAAHGDDMDMSGMDMGGQPAAHHDADHHGGAAATGFGEPYTGAKAARNVTITMGDLSFSPAHVDVKLGEAVRFSVTNASAVAHDFTLGDTATQTAHRKDMAEALQAGRPAHQHQGGNAITVPPGATRTLSWRFSKPGSFEYDCNIPGHFEAGMKGTITVSR
jgi:uncharacterized cupredoxin-like copper-binding protein